MTRPQPDGMVRRTASSTSIGIFPSGADRTPRPLAPHARDRVLEERMPVAHPDIHRQRSARSGQPLLQPFGLTPCQLGDGRDAAEDLVMMRNLFDPFRRNAPSAQDPLEERTHVGEAIGATTRFREHAGGAIWCHPRAATVADFCQYDRTVCADHGAFREAEPSGKNGDIIHDVLPLMRQGNFAMGNSFSVWPAREDFHSV